MLMLRSILAKLKKQQGKNKSSGFPRSFYLASFTLGYLWYYSPTAHAVKNLAKGKDNLKRPMTEEYNGEQDYEPTEKKVTRSMKTGMFFLSRKIVGNVTKWLAFLYTYTALFNTRAKNCLF